MSKSYLREKYETRAEAQRAGEKLRRRTRLRAGHWRVDPHQNEWGWTFSLSSRAFALCYNSGTTKEPWLAFLLGRGHRCPPGSSTWATCGIWAEHGRTAREAMENVIRKAADELNPKIEALRAAERVYQLA